MRLLLVEDEDPKRRHIENFVRSVRPDAEISIARSVRSAIASLLSHPPDLVLLDMSLPTFDIGTNETGGRPQGFGGRELMRNMELEDISCPVIVLTGYDAFNKAGEQVGLEELRQELSADHPGIFVALLQFNSAYGDWQDRLRSILDGMETDR